MKKLLIILGITAGFTASAGVITCSNNPNSPGQYDLLQDAINAANANDTILVHGSTIGHGNIYIQDNPVTIIGAGSNNPNGENTTINYLDLNRLGPSTSASGTRIIGIIVLNQLRINPDYVGGSGLNKGMTNVVIERCHVGGITFTTSGVSDAMNFDEILIKNNLVSNISLANGGGASASYDNVRILNNIIYSGRVSQGAAPDNSDVLVANNVFLWNDQPSFGGGGVGAGMIVNNNIFYYSAPNATCYNCSFSNNLTYFNANDSLIGTTTNNIGASGGANIIGQDPMFVNYPAGGAVFSYDHDYNLQPGSPAIGAGTDGTDIGIYGGVAPFTLGTNPAIPQMEEITTPLGATVSQGTSLNVQFKSYKQD